MNIITQDDIHSYIFEWNIDQNIIYLSPACASLLYFSEDLQRCNIELLQSKLHPEDNALLRRQIIFLLKNASGGNFLETVLHIRRPDSGYRRVLVRMLIYQRDNHGRGLRLLGECIPYDAAAPLSMQFARHKQLYDYVLLVTQNGMWDWDLVTDDVYYSPRYMELLGYDPAVMPGRLETWIGLLHPDEADSVRRRHQEIAVSPAHGDTLELGYRLLAADGSWHHVLSRGKVTRRNAQGRGLQMVGLYTDVTDMASIKATLELQSERMRYAFSAARDGIWDWNAEDDTVYYSPRYLSMVGYTEKNFPPDVSSWLDHIHPEERPEVERLQRSCLASPEHGDSFESIYRFRTAEGSWRWILGRGKVVKRDATGKGVRAVGVHTDITELRHAQESLRHLLDHDSLTGLYSRNAFEQALRHVQENNMLPVSIISCDMDGLKLLNDTLGHDAGDKQLRVAAGLLQSAVRRSDMVARVGGDELNILLPSCSRLTAEHIREQILRALETHNADPSRMPLFLSVGVATSDGTTLHAAALLKAADTAMLEIKKCCRKERRHILRHWLRVRKGICVDTDDDRL